MNYELTPHEQIEILKNFCRDKKVTAVSCDVGFLEVNLKAQVAKVLRLLSEQTDEQIKKAIKNQISTAIAVYASNYKKQDYQFSDRLSASATNQICALFAVREQEAVKAGIKEVVEWIKNNHLRLKSENVTEGVILRQLLIDKTEWQDKCKEWGIE